MDANRERARIEILYYITQFCMTHDYSDRGELNPGICGFVSDMDYKKVQVGDLILLGSAPVSKWYLSWLVEIKKGENQYCSQYLLESIESGKLMWWSNVGISFMNRQDIEEHPQWRWTDRQFVFADRWNKVCYKERDAWLVLPVYPVFGDNYEVTIGTRTRHGFDDYRPTKTFKDWRKVTKAMMAEYYDQCVDARK